MAGRGAERATSARLRIGDEILVDDVHRDVVLFVTPERVAGSTAILELLTPDGSILLSDELVLD